MGFTAEGGISGCAPFLGMGAALPLVLSSAPMSTRAPGELTTSAPMAILARNGGSNCGSSSGDGNGKADGVTGCRFPADTRGADAAGRRWLCAVLENPKL